MPSGARKSWSSCSPTDVFGAFFGWARLLEEAAYVDHLPARRGRRFSVLFDEADSLFGERSEVRDPHDHFANIEASYLLQRMEEQEGITILATSRRQHFDDAFVRRLSSVIEFPSPDAAEGTPHR